MRRSLSAAVLVGFGILIGSWWSVSRGEAPIAQATAAVPTNMTWQYKSLQVEANSLQSRLSAMGLDGWEVVSVCTLNSPSSTEQMLQVIAKRAH